MNFPRDGCSAVDCPRDGRPDGIPQAGSSPAVVGAAATLPEPCSNTDDHTLPPGWSPEQPCPDRPAGPAGPADGPGREEVKAHKSSRGGRGGAKEGGKEKKPNNFASDT